MSAATIREILTPVSLRLFGDDAIARAERDTMASRVEAAIHLSEGKGSPLDAHGHPRCEHGFVRDMGLCSACPNGGRASSTVAPAEREHPRVDIHSSADWYVAEGHGGWYRALGPSKATPAEALEAARSSDNKTVNPLRAEVERHARPRDCECASAEECVEAIQRVWSLGAAPCAGPAPMTATDVHLEITRDELAAVTKERDLYRLARDRHAAELEVWRCRWHNLRVESPGDPRLAVEALVRFEAFTEAAGVAESCSGESDVRASIVKRIYALREAEAARAASPASAPTYRQGYEAGHRAAWAQRVYSTDGGSVAVVAEAGAPVPRSSDAPLDEVVRQVVAEMQPLDLNGGGTPRHDGKGNGRQEGDVLDLVTGWRARLDKSLAPHSGEAIPEPLDLIAARPAPDRAAWLLSPVSSLGRFKVDSAQYEELRVEACALRNEATQRSEAVQSDPGGGRHWQAYVHHVTTLTAQVRQLESERDALVFQRDHVQRSLTDALAEVLRLKGVDGRATAEARFVDDFVTARGLVEKAAKGHDDLAARYPNGPDKMKAETLRRFAAVFLGPPRRERGPNADDASEHLAVGRERDGSGDQSRGVVAGAADHAIPTVDRPAPESRIADPKACAAVDPRDEVDLPGLYRRGFSAGHEQGMSDQADHFVDVNEKLRAVAEAAGMVFKFMLVVADDPNIHFHAKLAEALDALPSASLSVSATQEKKT